MKDKERKLLFCIVLNFLFGCIIQNGFMTSKAEENSFGPSTETLYHFDKALEQEGDFSFEYISLSPIEAGDALRHFVQTKRNNHTSSSKCGLAFIKRNHIVFTSHQFSDSNKKCLSGLTEKKRYLISLRKLII